MDKKKEKKSKDKKESEEDVQKMKVQYSLYESMKFGLGFGAGIFIWWIVMTILAMILFGGGSQSGPMM